MNRTSLAFLCGCVFTVAALTRCTVAPAHADTNTDPKAGVPHSGSRIKMNVIKTEDGASIPTGVLHDTTLDVDCQLRTAADGKLRCLPVVGQASPSGDFQSDCTTPIAVAETTCASPRYVVSYENPADGCGSIKFKIFKAGERVTMMYHLQPPSSCQGDGTPTDHAYYAIGDEVSPETFALATPGLE